MQESSIEQSLGRYGRELLADRAPAWEAFAAGELTEAEVVAARSEHESAEEFQENLAMFRPFSEQRREALVAQLLATPASEKHVHAPTLPTAKVIPLWRRPVAWAGVAAAAIAVFMLIQPGVGPTEQPVGDLPAFELEVAGGIAAQRSEGKQTGVGRYAADTEIEVIIRPQVRSKVPLQARLFAFQGPSGQALTTPLEVADSGSVRLKGQVGEVLGLGPGMWRLVFVVGAGDELPSDVSAVAPLQSHAAHPGAAGGEIWVESLQLEITASP